MKERLTGALILVALLVIVVPEMLSGPAPRNEGDNSAVTAAESGPPLRSYTMDLGGGAREGAQASQSALAPTGTPVDPAPVVQSTPTAPVTSTDPPASTPLQAALPPVQSPEAVVPASRAEPSPPPPPAAGGWWVQVGSFSQTANARRVAQQLEAAGLAAQVAPIRSNGKELFRVRAGPVADRAAAERLRERVAAAGHKGTLVAP